MYLAGVSCAGLGNVTVIDGIPAHHPSKLVLSQTTTEEERTWQTSQSWLGL